MSRSVIRPPIDPQAKSADAYHHGDLRDALIAVAREALETQAPEAVTLKALATRLGVSQPAPYRHFANREALLQAVAADGFRRFAQALQSPGLETPRQDGLEASMLAYVRFGQTNPGVYRLMFASPALTTAEADSSLAQASSAAFDLLLKSVGSNVPPARARATAVWIWATLHGIVMLDAQGLVAGPPDAPLGVEQVVHELAEAVRSRT